MHIDEIVDSTADQRAAAAVSARLLTLKTVAGGTQWHDVRV